MCRNDIEGGVLVGHSNISCKRPLVSSTRLLLDLEFSLFFDGYKKVRRAKKI